MPSIMALSAGAAIQSPGLTNVSPAPDKAGTVPAPAPFVVTPLILL